MMKNKKTKYLLSKTIFLILILVMLIGIISNPSLSLKSATYGLTTWFKILLPSLLPFFIISELLIELGFVDFIGKLLGPLMKPLFNVPGQGAFPLSMSIISGYPVGGKLTSRLREKKMLTREEGNRLICFTSTSGPPFMLGAVAMGMLGSSKLAGLILIPHYLSILIIGLGSSLILGGDKKRFTQNSKSIIEEIKVSYNDFLNTKISIGSLISKAVKESMDTILLIGGLVIFYSVLVEVLFGIQQVDRFISILANIIPLSRELIKGLITGFFEITIGCKSIALSQSSILVKLILINFIIGWSGISIHSQVLSFLNKTDLNSGFYVFSKFIHGILSSIFTYGLYKLRYQDFIIPSFFTETFQYTVLPYYNWAAVFFTSIKLTFMINFYLLLFSMFLTLILRVKKTKFN